MTSVLPLPPHAPSPSPDQPSAREAASHLRVLDCEVCIVGSDVTAWLVAVELANRGRDVVLLPGPAEAGLPLAGVLSPGFTMPTSDLIARVGEADALDLLALAAQAVAQGAKIAEAAGLSLGPKGRLRLARSHAADDLAREHELRLELAPDTSVLLDAADTAALMDTDLFTAALGLVPADRIDAAALRATLAGAARGEGVRVLDAQVTATDVKGLRKYIDTPRQRVRAFTVIFSGGLAMSRLVPVLRNALEDTLWVSGILDAPGRAVPYGGLAEEVGATGLAFHWDGEAATFAVETATRIRGSWPAGRVLRRHAKEAYPDLAQARVRSPRALRLATSRQAMPVVQEGEPGVFYAAAGGDAEIAHGIMAAGLIVGAIVEKDDRIALLQPFGLAPPVRTIGGMSRAGAYWHARFTAQLAAHTQAAAVAEAGSAAGEAPPAGARGMLKSAEDFARGMARAGLGLALKARARIASRRTAAPQAGGVEDQL